MKSTTPVARLGKFKVLLILVAMLLLLSPAARVGGQTPSATNVWNNAGSQSWTTSTNWTPASATNGPASTAIAEFDTVYPTSNIALITMAATGDNNGAENQAVGAIVNIGSALSEVENTTATGTLVLEGVTVNSIASTIVSSVGGSSGDEIEFNNGSSGHLTVQLANPTNIIQSQPTSSKIDFANTSITQATGVTASITFLGGGNASTTGGELELNNSGNNSFTGGITVGDAAGTANAGWLEANTAGSLSTGPITINTNSYLNLNTTALSYGSGLQTITINGTGGTGTPGALNTSSAVVASLTSNVTLGSNSTISVTNSAGSLMIDGTMGGGFLLTKSGAGTLVFAGANSGYNGSTTITNGTITVNGGSQLGTGALTVGNGSGNNNVTVNLNNAAQTIGTLSSGANPLSGATSSNEIIALGTSNALDIVQAAGASYDGAITGNTGSVSLDASSTNTLSLGGTNTYGGGTTINGGGGGALAFTAAIAMPTTGNITVNSNGQLQLSATGTPTFGSSGQTLTLNGVGTAANSGALRISNASQATWAGSVVLGSNSIISVTGSAIGTLSGQFSDGGFQLQKQGGGALELSGSNSSTMTGSTLIGNGTIQVDLGSAMGTGALTLGQTSTNNTALTLNNASQTVGTLSSTWTATSGTQTQVITLNGTALTINQTAFGAFGVGAVSTLTSTITGTGNVMLSSSSTNTLEFTDANTYGGGTTINGGTLQVANVSGSATGTNSVSVNNGGTLAGSLSPSQGFITGAVTVNSGGTISTSNGNTLALSGGLTFGSGPTSSTNSTFNLSGAASANALVATSGGTNSLVVNGTNAVTVTGTPSVGTYELFSVAGAAPSVGSFSLASAPAGMSYMISAASNQVDLQVGSIDESGTGSFGGTVLFTSVPNGGSYAGISSTTATKLSNSPNPGIEGTVATILIGTNNQGATVTPSMTWRSRTLAETPGDDGAANGNGFVNGTPTTPLPLISDVVDLYGMASGSMGATDVAPVPTDPFAFEMSFNPATLNYEGTHGNSIASHGNLYLASLVGGAWENTIVPDFAVAGGTTATYQGQTIQVGSAAAAAQAGNFNLPILDSFSDWASMNGVNASNIANYVGDWGVDTANNEAWAVIDHNSDFAVVPEPSTFILLAIGAAAAGWRVLRRRTA